ncbi:hypothetical protein [Mucilaginibacter sp. UYCu711]|uniref:hypothetical protein n=1 Tax=Mucilaginibacter sp. UYCu711 TaxID=3156339 RepID=UPI003D1C697E
MLLVILQVVVLITAILMPLSTRKDNSRNIKYKIDTDTSNSLYAVNAFGTLEKINRLNTTGHKPEVEN